MAPYWLRQRHGQGRSPSCDHTSTPSRGPETRSQGKRQTHLTDSFTCVGSSRNTPRSYRQTKRERERERERERACVYDILPLEEGAGNRCSECERVCVREREKKGGGGDRERETMLYMCIAYHI